MPHLKFVQRYWRFSSDELWLAGFCSLFSRSFWLLLMAIALGFSAQSLSHCQDGGIIIGYLGFSILILLSQVICEVFIIRLSILGTMLENQSRDGLMPKYLIMRLTLGTLQFLAAIFGCLLLSQHIYMIPCVSDFSRARKNFDTVLVAIVAISQIVEFSVVLCCMCILSSSKTLENENSTNEEEDIDLVDIWENRAKILCRSLQLCTCNVFGGNKIQDQYESVAHYLTMFFHHDGFLDIVPSDVVAGIILARIEQLDKQHKQRLRNLVLEGENYENSLREIRRSSIMLYENVTESIEDIENGLIDYQNRKSYYEKIPVRLLSEADEEDRVWLEEVSRYSSYAMAMYSHLLVLLIKPVTGSCSLCITHCNIQCIDRPQQYYHQHQHHNSNSVATIVEPMSTNSSAAGDTNSSNSSSTSHTMNRNNSICTSSCYCCKQESKSSTTMYHYPKNRLKKTVLGDNCFSANEAGVVYLTKDQIHAELIFASFHNDISLKPYAVFYDHRRHTVVIAIRGTLSLEDCLTDMDVTTAELREAGEKWGFDGRHRYAHGGMLLAAMKIREELEHCQAFLQIMSVNNLSTQAGLSVPFSKGTNKPDVRIPDLLVTGHSLGAGTAVILSLLLKPLYPHVRCISYGTPASVLDPRSSVDCRDYVTSVVLGDDLVCRMSFLTIAKLREQVLDCICRARVNKMLIMQALFTEAQPASYMYKPGQEPANATRDAIRTYLANIKTRIESTQMAELVIPGRIFHLKPDDHELNLLPLPKGSLSEPSSPTTNTQQPSYQNNTNKISSPKSPKNSPKIKSSNKKNLLNACFGRKKYNAYESSFENFQEIEITPTMGTDHFPHFYHNRLQRINEAWKRTNLPQNYNKTF